MNCKYDFNLSLVFSGKVLIDQIIYNQTTDIDHLVRNLYSVIKRKYYIG